MTEEENKWTKLGDKMQNAGDSMQKVGNQTAGCGCLLTLLITIPILIILFIL